MLTFQCKKREVIKKIECLSYHLNKGVQCSESNNSAKILIDGSGGRGGGGGRISRIIIKKKLY